MINKKKVEDYISKAIKEIELIFPECKEKGLPKELNGYICSFGASIIQSGLIPAVAFYERGKTIGLNEVAENRKKLMKIIGKLVYGEMSENNLLIERLVKLKSLKLEDYNSKKNDVIHSAIAIKLAIRLYKQVEKGDENG